MASDFPCVQWLLPGECDDNPANWKHHPAEQLEVLGYSLAKFKHLKPVGTYNVTTRRLLDGHARKRLLPQDVPAPYWLVELTEAEEAEALTILDPSGWTSVTDRSKFTALLAKCPKIEHAATDALLQQVRRCSTLLEPKDEEKPAEADSVNIPLDTLWSTDNELGVAALELRPGANQVIFPVTTWGSQGQRKDMHGTWHFYTWDDRFSSIDRRPHAVLWSGPKAIVEPNFSTTAQTPLWQAIAYIGRKRWLARYWQARGLTVLVDLNVAPGLNAPCELLRGLRPNLLGVPRGWAAYATRAHANNPELLTDEWEVAREHSGAERPTFLCVGGGRRVKELAKQNGWVWVEEQVVQNLGRRRDDAA
jgi:hypothetical protein